MAVTAAVVTVTAAGVVEIVGVAGEAVATAAEAEGDFQEAAAVAVLGDSYQLNQEKEDIFDLKLCKRSL